MGVARARVFGPAIREAFVSQLLCGITLVRRQLERYLTFRITLVGRNNEHVESTVRSEHGPRGTCVTPESLARVYEMEEEVG